LFSCAIFFVCFMFPYFFSHITLPTGFNSLSLHDALPISVAQRSFDSFVKFSPTTCGKSRDRFSARFMPMPLRSMESRATGSVPRSEEHTSELQSRENLVCRLLLEKKNLTS